MVELPIPVLRSDTAQPDSNPRTTFSSDRKNSRSIHSDSTSRSLPFSAGSRRIGPPLQSSLRRKRSSVLHTYPSSCRYGCQKRSGYCCCRLRPVDSSVHVRGTVLREVIAELEAAQVNGGRTVVFDIKMRPALVIGGIRVKLRGT